MIDLAAVQLRVKENQPAAVAKGAHMAFSLDHVVIAVSDLDRAMLDYSKLGFTVLRGGEHPRRGSVNALIVFKDGSYFELIGFPRPVPEFRWWEILQKAGPGFVDFALLPSNLEADLKEARSRGFAGGEIEPGGRITPSGERAEWQTLRPHSNDLPFLCADISPRSLRVPEGDARNHPNGALGIARLTVAVRDLPTSIENYRALLPEGWSSSGPNSAVFFCGAAIIELKQPTTGGVPADDALASHLDQRGEGLFAVSLRGVRDRKPFDPALTKGAPLDALPR